MQNETITHTIATSDRYPELSAEVRERMLAFYYHLHAHPELSGREHRTAAALAAELRASGLEVTEGVGGTGGSQNVAFATGSFAMQGTWSNAVSGCQISHAIVP